MSEKGGKERKNRKNEHKRRKIINDWKRRKDEGEEVEPKKKMVEKEVRQEEGEESEEKSEKLLAKNHFFDEIKNLVTRA
jgi:hypothetical protein